MAKKIEVTKIQLDDREGKVYVDQSDFLVDKKIQPEGRMLTDSEHLSFIYILDVEDDFIYVSFAEKFWNELNTATKKELPLFLQINETNRIPFIQFQEEFTYLLSNIQENSNYGERMVQAVNQTFFS
ncbi:hypothetical protein BKP45_13140 [Anaerobacillus alkalidiazotrophicus]|uniref:Uncharacterized protein n=1 Tax=Anaerobacillus alkalidiazotrophicus TaxID=472963 RepID=A0A1S2M1Q3_9BACI|nr:hypothetical protein [Anaerobacillus alkalidiazotrophicus]OIJ18506.1 hypothetical protein BKP45_18855 [Anaerobacillus alkalidiazotrophicus]OIJ19985.1 hypothetical protein BKP45_13140 [Anaerobacillus alkalidiazotrophicus]